MTLQFQSTHKLGNGRIDDKCVKDVDVIANENAGPLTIKARCILDFKSSASDSQNVPEKPALWPVVPARIKENAQEN
jgi:hypothetical protein